eukprot:GILK01002946.1.p1 GENE.GILK01002946.1~~GILK01002946.1.p1  ORF type:complete len:234 (+),score=15.48 GILK01002946.1:45-746(+)
MADSGYVAIVEGSSINDTPKAKFSPVLGRRFLFFLVLFVAYFALNVAALTSDWWFYSSTTVTPGSLPTKYTRQAMSLTSWTEETVIFGTSRTSKTVAWNNSGLDKVASLNYGMYFLQIVCVVTSATMVLCMVLQKYAPIFKHSGRGWLYLLLGSIFILFLNLLSIALYGGLLPGAIKSDMGSICLTGTTPCDGFFGVSDNTKWGGAAGWYCALVATLLSGALMGLIISMKSFF